MLNITKKNYIIGKDNVLKCSFYKRLVALKCVRDRVTQPLVSNLYETKTPNTIV